MFVDTGLEYPELREFVKSVENVTWVRPEMNFKTVIQTYGYPIVSKEISQVIEEARRHETTGKYTYRIKRLNGELLDKNGNKSIYNCEKWKFLLEAPFLISNKCCNVMKKKPAKKYEKETGNHPIIGTMACESQARKTAWKVHGCNAFDTKRPTSQPLSFWTEQDILEYIKKYNLPYAPVYGEIIQDDTRTVTHTDGKGHSYTTTETYWTWDRVESEDIKCKEISFCGVVFDSSKIELPDDDYIDTIKTSSHIRYKYYGIGTEYTGTIYTVLTDNTISNNTPFYNGLNIDETIDHLESSVELVIFWIVWIIVIIAVVIGFYYLDNKWLEDKK